MRRRERNEKTELLSVVVPAYKQEKTIVRDILNIQAALKQSDYDYELIVVIDGTIDKTYEKVSSIKSSKIKILTYGKNQGKGHAVRYGMLHACGDIIGFIDAGMDIHPSGLQMLLNHMEWYNADIIVGSKMHPVSKVSYPTYRRVLSWGFRFLTHAMFGFKVKDTQVGVKFLKRPVARDVLPMLLVKHYAFDVELLAVSYYYGYRRIFEAPVEINFQSGRSSISSYNLLHIIYLMLWDTLAVFYRLRIVRYYNPRIVQVKNRFETVPVG